MYGSPTAEGDPFPSNVSSSGSWSSAHPAAAIGHLHPDAASRLSSGTVTVVIGTLCLVSFLDVLTTSAVTTDLLLAPVYLAAILALQFGYFLRARTRYRPAACYPALIALAALVYAPLFQYGQSWVGLAGLFGSSVLLSLRAAVSVPLLATITLGAGWLVPIGNVAVLDRTFQMITTALTGLMIYGLVRLSGYVRTLHSKYDEHLRIALAGERQRFARDVHDLLGLSLSAITLKVELTSKLMAEHPERANDELIEILDISRKSLADTRSLANTYRQLRLDDECCAARAALTAADVEVHIDSDGSEFPKPVSTVLATVIREGVTNVLRHSKTKFCEITIRKDGDTARMDIVNDGVTRGSRSADEGTGRGIHNLEQRVSSLGGSLLAAEEPRDRYRLCVMIPLRE
ncbi:Signal transduction histidine kinase [Actinopolyspora mzabensis]|uniref:Signal transduction histidine kinase n=1 Tax=Actinopolyspora mzabensis TaxID=995066 RepID=A0A1G8Y5D4_ACTMZ|nr:histidine kinase [Actinopolyspora mzabensis]SDJ98016.1 Signal transduction histidine kinase [Actinopolyspora mzabensis]